jgi:hypothetical protein
LEENLLGRILLASGVRLAIFKTRRPHKLEENLLGHLLLASGVRFAILKTRRPHKLKKENLLGHIVRQTLQVSSSSSLPVSVSAKS